MTRGRTFASAAVVLGATVSLAAAAEPLKLEVAKPVTLRCETQAILIKDGGPAPTKGKLELRLEVKTSSPEMSGAWSPVSADDAHKNAFANMQKTACASGCPMTVSAAGDAQIWAPAPKSLDKLAAEEALLLAVIKADALSLKASRFRGQAIEALESGTCAVAPQ
ncbi:MAG: hypothetical protein ABL893_19125 [Hyphomicrobium sp.]